MDFYHGTQVGNITELVPFSSPGSNIKEAVVYLSTKRQIALHYASDYKKLPFSSPMLDIQEDCIVYQEMYSDALELSCKGVGGYIYHVIGEYEMSEDHGVKTCAISRKAVPVNDVEYIADIYDEIMKYKGQGKFIYEKYEDLLQYRHDIIRGHFIRYIKRDNIIINPDHPHYNLLQEKFPVYWKKAAILNENGML